MTIETETARKKSILALAAVFALLFSGVLIYFSLKAKRIPSSPVPESNISPSRDAIHFGVNTISIEHKLFSNIGVEINNHKNIWWGRVQKEINSNYDWSRIDNLVKKDQEANLLSYFTVHSTSAWASQPEKLKLSEQSKGRAHPPLQPKYYDQWEKFIQEMVERYDNDGYKDMPGLKYPVIYYQFGAEYGRKTWWSGTKEEYLEEWRRFVKAAREAYPQVRIVANGIAGLNNIKYITDENFEFSREKANQYFSNLKGSPLTKKELQQIEELFKPTIDFIKMVRSHPELFDIDDIRFYTYFKYEPERIPLDLGYLKSLHRYFGYKKPIFATEGQGAHLFRSPIKPKGWPKFYDGCDKGYTTCIISILKNPKHKDYSKTRKFYEKEKSIELIKVYTTLFAYGVSTFIYFPAHDNLLHYSHKEGTEHWQVGALTKIGEQYRIKDINPAFYTYGIMTKKLKNFTGLKRLRAGPDVYLYKFEFKQKEPVFVAWDQNKKSSLDMSRYTNKPKVKITHIVTSLDEKQKPVYPPPQIIDANQVYVNYEPIFIE